MADWILSFALLQLNGIIMRGIGIVSASEKRETSQRQSRSRLWILYSDSGRERLF